MVTYFLTIIYYLFLVFLTYYFLKNLLLKRDFIRQNCSASLKNNSDKSLLFKKLNLFFVKIGKTGKRILLKGYIKRLENLIQNDDTNNSTGMTTESFIGYKFSLSLLMFIFCIMLINNSVFMVIFALVGLAAGFFAPDYLIKHINSKRLIKMDRELPCIIDLLYIAALSGQNIYNSIKIVTEKYDCLISNELKVFLRQIDLGIGKKEAYSNILQRNNSDSFKSFIFTLQQAESYGSPISELLMQKAEFLRFETYQDIEKKIRLISTKMLFPLIFLILPAFIMLVCGPLIYLVGKNVFLKI